MKKQTNTTAAGRKLTLNKKTISNLTATEMGNKVGGSTGCYPHTGQWCGSHSYCGCGGTKNGNTCFGHNTCYNC